MENQRLLYNKECKDCNHKSSCEWVDTPQYCREIIYKLRDELHKNRKRRKIVAKINVTTEYVNNNYKKTETIAEKGTFVLQEPYKFGEPFLRGEIQGEGNGGTFLTEYFGWNK